MDKLTLNIKQIGLITCTREKKPIQCQARELYSESPDFRRHLAYAEKNYDKVYVVSGRYGLITLDHVLSPYDCWLGNFTHEERKSWATFVVACLFSEGINKRDKIYLHTTPLYREYLNEALYQHAVNVRWIDFEANPPL